MDARVGNPLKAVLAASTRMPAVAAWKAKKSTDLPQTLSAIWLMIDGFPSGYARAWVPRASAVIPANIVIARTPIIVRVAAALRLFGGRKAGTPLLIASTPVSAVQPLAKARGQSSRV